MFYDLCRYTFNVDNERENVDEWITSITNVCERLVMDSIENDAETTSKSPIFQCASPSAVQPEDKALNDILALSQLPHNSTCADCGSEDSEWCSTNLGTFICLQCSGVHRSFGTHVSQIRSVRLDKWNPSQVNFMAATGNVKANQIWEYSVPTTLERIKPTSNRKQRETWLTLKYLKGRFKKDYVAPEIDLEGNIFADLITPTIMKETTLDRLGNDPEFCRHLYDVIFNT